MTNDKHIETGEFFDRIADDYAMRSEGRVWNTSSLSFARRQEIVEKAIGQLPDKGVVLDYGMGPAVFADQVVAQKCNYIGIDISRKMIELAKAKNLPRCEFVQGDLAVLSEYKCSSDRVLLIGLLDYLQEPYKGLEQLGACVRPGGSIIMSFRNKHSLPFLLREMAKGIWRKLHVSNKQTDRAFDADVLENAFDAKRELVPHLKKLGFESFSVSFLDASPIFFRVNLPKRIWRCFFVADKLLSKTCLSFLAASGVLKATKN